ncbi:hypothetical protein [Ectothiorhodospira lacustris]|uniref:hypothetical protein n=1 Tax=Ectothiorhodospira lacustris TaxID=2899127 RepID=UPI001EE8F971|nr:hypothetical protein [Ectothiorhodospira lacustris]MCG5509769.1 hypothetical protein [Ectothiorhodospira lacustris]MCG5522317.1 hypothetical protein [Ectothiorhodospira lacustris]
MLAALTSGGEMGKGPIQVFQDVGLVGVIQRLSVEPRAVKAGAQVQVVTAGSSRWASR